MPPAHACDSCKRRKVKCDGTEPCSNCRISGHRCCYTGKVVRRSVRRPDSSLGAGLSPVVVSAETVTRPELPFHLDTEQLGGNLQNISFHLDAVQVHSALLASAGTLLGPESLVDVAHECIDFFVQYLFPNTPVAHEPTLRAATSLLEPDGHSFLAVTSLAAFDAQSIACLRQFTLITALCAFVSSAMGAPPASRAVLSKLFLDASRAMLRVYDAHDLEHPDSTSLTIRMWYSATMQNTTGRVGSSYQYHAEAAFLARRLQLHDEAAIHQYPKPESQILRASFWLLYLADKTGIAFETRPPVLYYAAFDGELTLRDHGENEDSLLDNNNPLYSTGLQDRIFTGFHLKRHIWDAAARLLVDIKSTSLRTSRGEVQPGPQRDEQVTRLAEAYLLFEGLMDQLPSWLRSPDTISDGGEDLEEKVAAYQRTCFWTQRSNIVTVFHCMRLVILQRCIAADLCAVVGLDGQPMSHAMRKTEIARDFLHELQVVPFRCFKAQGETAVERIRRVGTILLELVHNAENKTIETVARSQFEQLLDLLAKLDSRASDELASGPA